MKSTLPQVKENKPSEDVMNFFNKKTHGMLSMKKRFSNQSQMSDYQNDLPVANQDHGQNQNNIASSRQNGNSARMKEGKTDEEEERERMEEKMRMTDFALKLTELKDRIELKTVGGNRKKSQLSSEKNSPKDLHENNPMPHKRPTRALRLSQIQHGNKSMLNFPEISLNAKDEQYGIKINKHSQRDDLRKQNTQLTPKHLSSLQLVQASNEAMNSKNSRKGSMASELPQMEIKEEENYQEDDQKVHHRSHHKHQLSQYAIQHNKDKLAKEELSKNGIYVKKLQQQENARVIEIKRRQQTEQPKSMRRDLNSKSTPHLKYSFQSNNLATQNSNNHHLNLNHQSQYINNNFHLPKVSKEKPQTSPRLEDQGQRSGIDKTNIDQLKVSEPKAKKKSLKRSNHQKQTSGQFVKLEISSDQIKPMIKETNILNKRKLSKPRIAEQHQQLILNRPGPTRNLEKLRNSQNSPKYYITGISQNQLEKVYMKKNESFVNLNSTKDNSLVKKKIKKDRSITNTILETVLNQNITNRTQVPPIISANPSNISVKKTKSQNQLSLFKQHQQLSSSVANQLENSRQNIKENQHSHTMYNEIENTQGKHLKQIQKEEEMRQSFSPLKNNQKLQALVQTYSTSRIPLKVQMHGSQNHSNKKNAMNNSKINNKSQNEDKLDKNKLSQREEVQQVLPQDYESQDKKEEGEPVVQVYHDESKEGVEVKIE